MNLFYRLQDIKLSGILTIELYFEYSTKFMDKHKKFKCVRN